MSQFEKSFGMEGNEAEIHRNFYTKEIRDNFRALMDSWNPEVKDLPPEKVIRDFNSFVLLGKFRNETIRTLAAFVPDLSEENLKRFSTLINYYHYHLDIVVEDTA